MSLFSSGRYHSAVLCPQHSQGAVNGSLDGKVCSQQQARCMHQPDQPVLVTEGNVPLSGMDRDTA